MKSLLIILSAMFMIIFASGSVLYLITGEIAVSFLFLICTFLTFMSLSWVLSEDR